MRLRFEAGKAAGVGDWDTGAGQAGSFEHCMAGVQH